MALLREKHLLLVGLLLLQQVLLPQQLQLLHVQTRRGRQARQVVLLQLRLQHLLLFRGVHAHTTATTAAAAATTTANTTTRCAARPGATARGVIGWPRRRR